MSKPAAESVNYLDPYIKVGVTTGRRVGRGRVEILIDGASVGEVAADPDTGECDPKSTREIIDHVRAMGWQSVPDDNVIEAVERAAFRSV